MNAHELKQLQVRLTKAKAEREIAWARSTRRTGWTPDNTYGAMMWCMQSLKQAGGRRC